MECLGFVGEDKQNLEYGILSWIFFVYRKVYITSILWKNSLET